MEQRGYLIHRCQYTGHFLPEEDDKFLDRVKAAVEEEERQSMAAADTDAAKDAIATAEESRKHIQTHQPDSQEPSVSNGGDTKIQEEKNEAVNERVPKVVAPKESRKPETNVPGSGSAYNSVASLPMEFYHYYHGSSTDMGTLIEVIPINMFRWCLVQILQRE